MSHSAPEPDGERPGQTLAVTGAAGGVGGYAIRLGRSEGLRVIADAPRYRREDGPAGMIIERDAPVPVRGGITVYADVFRPAAERPVPVLVAWSPYGKHAGPQLPERYPDGGVAPGQLSAYTAFESPDPVHWAARGYAVVNADIPGTWHSGGDATFLSPRKPRTPTTWSNGQARRAGATGGWGCPGSPT